MLNGFVLVPGGIGPGILTETDGFVERHGSVKVRDHAPDKREADDPVLLIATGSLAQGRRAQAKPRHKDRDYPPEYEIPIHGRASSTSSGVMRCAEPTGSARRATRRDPRSTVFRARPCRCETP